MTIRDKASVAGIILIILLATAISGCTTPDDGGNELSAGNTAAYEQTQLLTTIYSENDSQSTVHGIIGDTYIIQLAGNPQQDIHGT
ncbi:MAG: hypothetical protein R2741_08900 [Methanolobus sp.]